MACRSLAYWASESEKLLAQKENLLVLDDRTALFSSPEYFLKCEILQYECAVMCDCNFKLYIDLQYTNLKILVEQLRAY